MFNPDELKEKYGLTLIGADEDENNRPSSNHRTVPNVWVGGKQIGGDSDVTSAFDSGDLQKRLQAAGVQLK